MSQTTLTDAPLRPPPFLARHVPVETRVPGKSAGAPLRVLMVTPRFFPFMGGVENHVYEVARRMVQDNVVVTVLTTDPTLELNKKETLQKVEILRVPAYPADRDFYWAPGLTEHIRAGAWDVVHIQSYHTLVAPLAMYAALRAHIPYVVTFHSGGNSSLLRNRVRGVQHKLLRPLLVRAKKLVTIADFERELLEKHLGLPDENFVTIPNGCDLPQLAGIPPAVQPNLIASIGRLERYKGHQRVIAALPLVLEKKPDAHLWIAGSGPYEDELRNLARELGVAEHVSIVAIPPQDRSLMARSLARAALVVLLSDYETHPIAVLEALSLKRPVLVSETSGLKELVERGSARGIAPGSTAQQIADAIVQQLNNPFVPQNVVLPTWDECTKNLLDLYRAVCGGQSAGSNVGAVLS